MQNELNEAADAGYRFEATMGGETAFGGSEVIVIMSKDRRAPSSGRYMYKLLATNKTSTMQKELQTAGDEGFQYKGQTVFKTAYGGKESRCHSGSGSTGCVKKAIRIQTPGHFQDLHHAEGASGSRRCWICICGNDDLEHRIWRKGSSNDPAQGICGIMPRFKRALFSFSNIHAS